MKEHTLGYVVSKLLCGVPNRSLTAKTMLSQTVLLTQLRVNEAVELGEDSRGDVLSFLRSLRNCRRKEGAVMFCEGAELEPHRRKLQGKRFELRNGIEHLALLGPRQVWTGIYKGICSQAIEVYDLFSLT